MAKQMEQGIKLITRSSGMNIQMFFEAIKIRAIQYAKNYLRQNNVNQITNFKGVQAVYTVILTPEPLLKGQLGEKLHDYILKQARDHPRTQQALLKLKLSGINI